MTPAVGRVIDRLLDDEGGIKDVGDGKGVTRFGQTPAWLSQHALPVPLTRDDAQHNYDVWMSRLRFSDLIERDELVGWIVADMGVHFGEGVAIRTLQRVLKVGVDGVIGPKTLAAYVAVSGTRAFRQKFLAEKGRAYGALLASEVIDRRKWARGWMNRYAEQIEALP